LEVPFNRISGVTWGEVTGPRRRQTKTKKEGGADLLFCGRGGLEAEKNVKCSGGLMVSG